MAFACPASAWPGGRHALFDLRTRRGGGGEIVAEGAHDDRGRACVGGLVALVGAVALSVGVGACGGGEDEITLGLITKQEENPFFVTMRDVAEDTADETDVNLLTAAGKSDVDNASQVAALADMTQEGAKGIMIVPANSRAIVPAIERARDAGVIVVALDTPTQPASAVEALYATDNRRAGNLIGRYAKAKAEEDGIEPRIAMLDWRRASRGELRHNGSAGFGSRTAIRRSLDPHMRRQRGQSRVPWLGCG